MPAPPRADRHTEPGRGAKRARWREGVLLAGGVLVAMAAWFVLVVQAIAFGRTASSAVSWVLLVLATLGAVACMFLAILLATRLVSLRSRGRGAREEPTAPPPTITDTAPRSYPDGAPVGTVPPQRQAPEPDPEPVTPIVDEAPRATPSPAATPAPHSAGHRRGTRQRGKGAPPRREGGARRAPRRRRGD